VPDRRLEERVKVERPQAEPVDDDLDTRRRSAILRAPRKGPATQVESGLIENSADIDQQMASKLVDKWLPISST
jgi:hypothetical protein